MKKKIVIPIVVVVALLVAAGIVVAVMPAEESQGFTTFSGLVTKLEAAGTAKVTFRAEMRGGGPAAEWEGTSTVRFGAAPAWDTRFTKMTSTTPMKPYATVSMTLRRIQSGGVDDFQSDAFELEPGASWVRGAGTVSWPNQIIDPQTNVTELPTWLPLIGVVQEEGYKSARSSGADHLADLPGAPHRYLLHCGIELRECPATLSPTLGLIFNQTDSGKIGLWADDEGNLRQLSVEYNLSYNRTKKATDPAAQYIEHPVVGYVIKATFTISDYGTPFAAVNPDRKTISKKQTVQVKP